MPPSPDPKAGSDDGAVARLSDAALRKKKNADAQAAFRARRANYIATLEETGAPKPSPSRGSRQLIPPRPAPALPQSPT